MKDSRKLKPEKTKADLVIKSLEEKARIQTEALRKVIMPYAAYLETRKSGNSAASFEA